MKTKHVRSILIESKEYSVIHKFGDCLDTHAELQKWHGDARPIYQELILISLEDEKIEEGDEFVHYWFNENSTNKDRIVVSTADKNTNDKKHRKSFIGKVIARQSQIPPEYITKFIEQYNKGCIEDLEIEMEYFENDTLECIGMDGEPNCVLFNGFTPKLTNGFITIVEKEPISYTEEEVLNLLHKLELDKNINLAAWFENNKKK